MITIVTHISLSLSSVRFVKLWVQYLCCGRVCHPFAEEVGGNGHNSSFYSEEDVCMNRDNSTPSHILYEYSG